MEPVIEILEERRSVVRFGDNDSMPKYLVVRIEGIICKTCLLYTSDAADE